MTDSRPTPHRVPADWDSGAHALFLAGNIGAATQRIIEVANGFGLTKPGWVIQQLSYYLYSAGDYASCANVLEPAWRNSPSDIELGSNLVVALRRSRQFQRCIDIGQQLLKLGPDNTTLLDALAPSYAALGQLDAARQAGSRALDLKDASAAKPPTALQIDANQLKQAAGKDRLICFSLFGEHPRYLRGALRNLLLAPDLYPGWRLRFYLDDSVPRPFVRRIERLGGEVVPRPGKQPLGDKLIWRFAVANDPAVGHFLVRDADSVFSLRETDAVQAWLTSHQPFHIIRDWWSHTDLILAGTWGGIAGLLPNLADAWQRFRPNTLPTANIDQLFLRQIVWPQIRDHALIHDRCFSSYRSQPFPNPCGDLSGDAAHDPSLRPRPDGRRHVGVCEFAVDADFQQRQLEPWLAELEPTSPARDRVLGEGHTHAPAKRFVFPLSTGRNGTVFLSKLFTANLADASVYHERTGYQSFGQHTPDASHFTLFNSIGNVREVREFWRRKFASDLAEKQPNHVEMSHFLAKAGLVENLDLLLDQGHRVDLLILQRDTLELLMSFVNRFDFANTGFTWLFTLDHRYPNVIVDSSRYASAGMVGKALWYIHEMQVRFAYYQRLFEGTPGLHMQRWDMAQFTQASGATQLLNALELPRKSDQLDMPSRQNATRQTLKIDGIQDQARDLVEQFRIDTDALARDFIDSGRRLATPGTPA